MVYIEMFMRYINVYVYKRILRINQTMLQETHTDVYPEVLEDEDEDDEVNVPGTRLGGLQTYNKRYRNV